LERNGEIYWNRLHQIQNIQICIEHNCFLEDCINVNHDQKKYPLFFPSIKSCPIRKPRYNESENLLTIAKSCVKILFNEYQINFDYISRARRLGYGFGNRVKQIEIENDFNEFYSESYFSPIEYSQLLFIKYKITNPYRHILLDYFFSTKERQDIVAPFYKKKFWDKGFFGQGPWACINPKCKFFGKMTITEPEFNYDGKSNRTVGLFTCSCGSMYTMSFMVKENNVIKTNIKKIRESKRGIKLVKSNDYKEKQEVWQKEWAILKSAKKTTSEQKRRLYYLSARLKSTDPDWKSKIAASVKKIDDAKAKERKLILKKKQIQLVQVQNPV
jgi:hypothetical protein